MNELRRTRDGIIGGVCGGFAKWFGIDQTLVRIIFAILAFGYGIGIGFYIICWILMPEED